MKPAPIPVDEEKRMEAVHRLAILDTKPEARFDALTKEATQKMHMPMSTLTIVDSKREWFKSCQGMDETEGSRETSFCGHALFARDMFIVEDTLLDERFKDNPKVVGSPFIRFYAGIALIDHHTGQPVGVFCVKDIKPRKLSAGDIAILTDLAERAEKELNA